jgi:hypothetical protein
MRSGQRHGSGSSVVHKFMKMAGDRKRGNGFDTTPQSDGLGIRWCYISHRIYDIFEFTFIQDMETLVSSDLYVWAGSREMIT